MMRNQKNKRNFWKAAFLSLLFAVAVAVFLIFGLLTDWFSGGQPVNVPPHRSAGQAVFTVQANKKQLEAMINSQINKDLDPRLSYSVKINDQLILSGKYKLLFTAIPFSITFDPAVSQGNIILKEADVKLGSLKLPDKEVLNFLKSGSGFPKWVIIQPDQQQIYIDLTQVEIQKGLSLQAKTINLAEDTISFTVHQKPE
ncbi:DUF2140 family protein [Sporolactobacillus sp. THM7-4]|nr:DUF2140 family protein [Sporolactobacillus sp. THM7-4]